MVEGLSEMKKTFILAHQTARNGAIECVRNAPDGHVVTISEPTKRRIQEEKYHAMIGEIAEQSEYAGRKWGSADMKRILIDEFSEEMRQAGTPLHHDSRIIPSENGKRIIQLEIRSSEFWVSEASQFIEFLTAWGIERGVVFGDMESLT